MGPGGQLAENTLRASTARRPDLRAGVGAGIRAGRGRYAYGRHPRWVPAARIPTAVSGPSHRGDGPAGCLDLLLGGTGELVDSHVDLDVQLTGSEDLDRVPV